MNRRNSGFGYWLSRRAMEVVAKARHNGDWAEDRWVANVLANAGIYGMNDGLTYVAPGPQLPPELSRGEMARILIGEALRARQKAPDSPASAPGSPRSGE